MLAVIIFIIILSVLVFVHEAGHLIAAKTFGIRVDEFGLGYPPRAKKLFRWRNTDFTLNWLPFGGFVKIFGEDPTEPAKELDDARANVPRPTVSREQLLIPKDSFQAKNGGIKAAVLVAGVLGNFLLAWLLISIGFMAGMETSPDLGLPVSNVHTAITQVLTGSPADKAGLKSGDTVVSISRAGMSPNTTPQDISAFIAESYAPINIEVARNGETIDKSITPSNSIIQGKPAIGFALDSLGTVKLGFGSAFLEGFKTTVDLTRLTAQALWGFFAKAFGGHPDFSEVTGPVGIVNMVGDVEKLGFVYILSFAALISINLSIINLIPFPALDGGRLLFVIIEAIIRRSIPPRLANSINTIGFALLIFLMVLVTFRDIQRLL